MKTTKNNETCPIPVWSTDPDVLDCAICLEPMTIPVFQCENGHTGCSSCCIRVHNKCPSCSLPIGMRCWVIEKVLESTTKACQNQKFGCKETVSYNKKNEHDKACKYKPCTCPFSGCNYVSSFNQMSPHFTAEHPGSTMCFSFITYIQVKLDAGARLLVLQEEKGNDLFVLHRREERLGSAIWLSRLSPDSSSKEVMYSVSATGKLWSFSMDSIRICTHRRADDDGLPLEGFFVIPSDFFGTSGEFSFDLTIYEGNPC